MSRDPATGGTVGLNRPSAPARPRRWTVGRFDRSAEMPPPGRSSDMPADRGAALVQRGPPAWLRREARPGLSFTGYWAMEALYRVE